MKTDLIKSKFENIKDNYNKLLYSKYDKYIVDYKIEDDNIIIYSNINRKRKVKNTKENMKKINQVIVENKIKIAKKIDNYEDSRNERVIVLSINILLLSLATLLVLLTFFIGNYTLFLVSIILFSMMVISSSMIGTSYFILVKEIQNLKRITGYKKSSEIELPKINFEFIKQNK